MSAEAVQTAVSERFPQATTATSGGGPQEPAANEFVIFSKPELGRLLRATPAGRGGCLGKPFGHGRLDCLCAHVPSLAARPD